MLRQWVRQKPSTVNTLLQLGNEDLPADDTRAVQPATNKEDSKGPAMPGTQWLTQGYWPGARHFATLNSSYERLRSFVTDLKTGNDSGSGGNTRFGMRGHRL